jgi:DNA-binding HxlR family transcriptional regulator
VAGGAQAINLCGRELFGPMRPLHGGRAVHFLYYSPVCARITPLSPIDAEEPPVRAQTSQDKYGQFCPVAMAAEVICTRWTPLVLRELLAGSTRFNDIRRGVPRMSPTLLSKRLKEMAKAGIITAKPANSGTVEYRLTRAGEELRDIVMPLGVWGQRWIESSSSLKQLDPSLLMWDMRRNLVASALPGRERCTIQFNYPEFTDARKSWWLVIENGSADLCSIDPGFDVDLHLTCSLRSMTAIWMGHATLRGEIAAGNVELSGDKALARSMHGWLGYSPFAKQKQKVRAAS